MRILVHGATGRMGRAVITMAAHDPHIVLAAAVTRAKHAMCGLDAGEQAGIGAAGVLISDANAEIEDIDVVVDFTNDSGVVDAIALADKLNAALVSGSTGIGDEQREQLRAYSCRKPVLWSANMSPAIALLERLVRESAQALPDADIEIHECHHRYKKDAPSGTALSLAKQAAKGRGEPLEMLKNCRRATRPGPRESGEIGMSVSRGGSVAGEHRVGFYLDGEYLALSHHATERDIFARGALRAAHWLLKQPAGLYRMEHVLQGE
ncbi:MAG: 4-hydroxy-tetrahydrodipicolinate reductase [Xanthomonadales bacterium]|nr:4-hydroxy-tetrahydrodipicolinate reductase [Xanthomonadales bacterium]